MIKCFVSNKFNTVFEYICVTLLQPVAIWFCLAFMTFHMFPAKVGKNSDCDVADIDKYKSGVSIYANIVNY